MHPFIVSSKPHLNLGQLSDVHISARQAAFRDSTVSVLPGVAGVKKAGEMVNTTLDSFCDMLKQMGDDGNIERTWQASSSTCKTAA